MARRKKTSRSFARRSFGKARRYARKAVSGNKLIQIDSMLYGAVRPTISNKLTPMAANMLPASLGGLSQYTDELVMAIAAWAGVKYGSGMVRDVARKGLTIENYRIGEKVAGRFITNSTSTTSSVSAENWG